MTEKLPHFPNFKKLDLSHGNVFRSFVNDFPSSDFNFAGLFTWDIDDEVAVSSLNGNLVISSRDYLTRQRFYSFIGKNRVEDTIDTLINYAQKRNEGLVLKLVPESVIKHLGTKRMHRISEDEDNHDYIYLVNDWAEFRGRKFTRKKNILNNFSSRYGTDLEEMELDLGDKKVQKDIESVMARWRTSRGKKDSNTRDESKAIMRALTHHEILGIRAFGLYYNKKLIAFILFEVLPNKTVMGHFERADAGFKGIFVYLKHAQAKHFANLGVKFINAEQDLGIEGLRKSKQSLHPATYIKKYTIERIT